MSSAPAHVLAPWVETTPRRCRDEHDIWGNRIGTDRHIDAARLQLLQEILDAFQEQRERDRLRAVLYSLKDWELQDIGIARGEIDYVASNRSIDPRGARSILPMNV